MGKHYGQLWVGETGDDLLMGGESSDCLHGRGGHDWLAGGAGRDLLFGGWGDDRLDGGADSDVLVGGHGDDQLEGSAGDDLVFGGCGDDVLTYRSGDGSDYFDGGRWGTDVLRLDSVGEGWTLNLRCGRVLSDEAGMLRLSSGAAGTVTLADGSVIRFRDVEQIETVGGNRAPTIDEIALEAVKEGAAEGTVVGMVLASDPDAGDTLTYALTDDADGCFAIDPTTGEVTVANSSMLDCETATQHSITVQVTDAGGLCATQTVSIEVALANSGDDVFEGGDGADVVDGGAGNDRINGGGGNDYLIGGAGDDEIEGGGGNDILDGGDGADLLSGGDGDDQIDGGGGDDLLFGNSGSDRLSGGDGHDQLYGGLNGDWLDGGAGDDWLYGNGGNDALYGGAGDDMLFASLGNDLLVGGAGNDTLSGWSGADRFQFDATEDGFDTITDFGDGDVLVFTGLVGFTAGREAEYVSLQESGGNTTVLVDVDGAANGSVFDPVAVLNGVTGISLTDLVNAGRVDIWATS